MYNKADAVEYHLTSGAEVLSHKVVCTIGPALHLLSWFAGFKTGERLPHHSSRSKIQWPIHIWQQNNVGQSYDSLSEQDRGLNILMLETVVNEDCFVE